MFRIHVAPPSFVSVPENHRTTHHLRRARKGVKCCTSHDEGKTSSYSASSLETKTTATMNGAVTGKTLGEKKIFGGSNCQEPAVYKERFHIRSSQIGVNKTATIETIASFLQDTTCNRVQRLGWSSDGFPAPPSMRKHGLTWVTSRVHIEMNKYPVWGDEVEIEHWTVPDRRIAVMFYFLIRNLSTGEVIGRSTSKWLVMNQYTRKLHKLSGEVWEEVIAVCQKSQRPDQEKNNPNLSKIPKLNQPADYSQLKLMPRRADLDMNGHVNNVTFYTWLLQSIPQDVVESHELEAITIEYQRECQSGNTVDSLASSEDAIESLNALHHKSTLQNLNLNSEGQRQFLHLLKFSDTSCEINRSRTVWRKMHK